MSLDLRLVLPRDIRFAPILRDVAEQAARYAGCGDAVAEAFGWRVDAAARDYLEDHAADGDVPITIRRHAGSLEVRIVRQTLTLDL